MSTLSSIDDLVLLGEALLLDDELEGATLVFLQAVRLDPENRNAALGLGHALLARGDHLGAITHLTGLLERYPNDLAVSAALLECLETGPSGGAMRGRERAGPEKTSPLGNLLA